jgi:hypothetical protein
MNKSESIKEIAKALHECQGKMGGVVKNSANPFFKSSYADLTAVLKAAKPVWHEQGITVIQHPHSQGNAVGVSTLIMHTSGEWIEHEYTLPLVKPDPQAAGSAITYARRYALAAVGLLPQIDNDAEDAMLRAPEVSKKRVQLTDDRDEYGRKILTSDEREEQTKLLGEYVKGIKECIGNDDAMGMSQLWDELDDDQKTILWVAPTKGGPFTKEERQYISDVRQKIKSQVKGN